MAIYIYVSEQDRTTKRKVEDNEVNEVFQQALKYDPSLMIEQKKWVVKKWWFKKEIVVFFQIYHETPAHDGSAYQARHQLSGSGDKKTVTAYLHGIINGCINRN